MEAQTTVPSVPDAHPVQFHGSASQYFGIWIVNILLSIVTLGIYSAWAKVRRQRYFYGNTSVMGHAFEYHADPIAILKGRLIVVAALIAYYAAQLLFPLGSLVLLLLFVPLYPVVFMLSWRFNARVTSWRNVHFFFDYKPKRDYLTAFGVLVLLQVAAAMTAYLLIPLAAQRKWKLVLKRLSYGRQRFHEAIPAGPIFRGYFLSLLVGLPAWIALVGGFVLLAWMDATSEVPDDETAVEGISAIATPVMMGLVFAVAIISVMLAYAIYTARLRNTVFNNSEIEDVGHATSRLRPVKLWWIMVTNTIAVLCSLGLATPWAAVRMWRYQVETLAFTPAGDLDAVVDRETAAGTAVGAEWTDFEGIDLGF